MLEMERFDYRGGENEQGAIARVLNLPKGFESVSLPVVRAWATCCNVPVKILRVLCCNFEHKRRVQIEGCVAEPPQTITPDLSGLTWSF